jgi:hypothetical protein
MIGMHFGQGLVERTPAGFAAIALTLHVDANTLPAYRQVKIRMLTFAEQLKLTHCSAGDTRSRRLVPVCSDVIIVFALLNIHYCPGGPL